VIIQIGSDCTIRDEIGKRVAACQMCDRPIPKGERRIVVYYRLSGGYQTRLNGSRFNQCIKRFHPECLTSAIMAGEEPHTNRCFDCQEPIEGRVLNFATRWSSSSWGNAPLCSRCATSPRWKFCHSCSTYVPVHSASQLIEEGVVTQRWCCDRCARNLEVLTVKMRKSIRRINENRQA